MTEYRSAPTSTLRHGDTLVFNVKGRQYRYRVVANHLSYASPENNRTIFRALKIKDRNAFVSAAYGYPDSGGDFPECECGDYAALTRVAKALFLACKRSLRGLPKAQREAIRREEARIRREAREAKAKARREAREAKAKARREALQAQKQYASAIAQLSPRHKDLVEYLVGHRDAFGCQREHVFALLKGLTGVDFHGVIVKAIAAGKD